MRRAVLLLALAVALGGCGTGDGDRAPAPAARPSAEAPPAHVGTPARAGPVAPRCPAGASRSLAHRGVAAVALRPTTAHSAPTGHVVARFALRNVNGVPTTFRVLEERRGPDCRPEWYRVQLPIRPNGAEGWVRAQHVRPYAVAFRILVDLSDRLVAVYRGDDLVAETPAAIGRPGTPTPTGSFYVNQRLLAPDPSGPFGPGGIGISAFSPVLTGWAQGGPIAIHGTNRPDTIGEAASNGCLRIDNAVLERLIHVVPDGTPVVIRA